MPGGPLRQVDTGALCHRVYPPPVCGDHFFSHLATTSGPRCPCHQRAPAIGGSCVCYGTLRVSRRSPTGPAAEPGGPDSRRRPGRAPDCRGGARAAAVPAAPIPDYPVLRSRASVRPAGPAYYARNRMAVERVMSFRLRAPAAGVLMPVAILPVIGPEAHRGPIPPPAEVRDRLPGPPVPARAAAASLPRQVTSRTRRARPVPRAGPRAGPAARAGPAPMLGIRYEPLSAG